jgi:hypothetical protein
MRLWSLHPRYLDRQGLLALWREALLARAVLRGLTRGYRHHPQLARFSAHRSPCGAISAYLGAIHDEATVRGYSFERSKVGRLRDVECIRVTRGQLEFEWQHLLAKLAKRSPAHYQKLRLIRTPSCHPLVRLRAGDVEAWERYDPDFTKEASMKAAVA